MSETFRFKQFSVFQSNHGMKVNTDGVLLGAWADVDQAHKVLDIGTGTGVIALMMAQRNTITTVDAIEIDKKAALQASENIDGSPWAKRLRVYHTALQDYIPAHPIKYDLIISNPPFFTAGTLAIQRAEANARHTSTLSHDALINCAEKLLSTNGRIALILPPEPAYKIIEYAESLSLYPRRITGVYPDQTKRLERVLLELHREKSVVLKSELHIRDSVTKDFSKPYRELTKEFYLKF